MYGSGSLTRSGVTLALFPLVSRPPSSGGVILGSASYIDKLFDTGEFALSRSCIRAKHTQGVYQKSATGLCQIRCGFANSTPGGIWPVDQETSRQNMRTDRSTRQGARSRRGTSAPSEWSNEHGIAAFGAPARRLGSLTVRAVAVLAGLVPRLPPFLVRIGARRAGPGALTEPVENEAGKSQGNRRADRPSTPRSAVRPVRRCRVVRTVGRHSALRPLAA